MGSAFPAQTPDHMWEYTLRSLSTAPADRLLNDTRDLISAKCTCFERLAAATHAYMPFSSRSRAAFRAYQRSSAVNARVAMHLPTTRPDARDMLFVMRRGSRRIITNEGEVLSVVLAAQPRLRVVDLQQMPMARQLVIVSEASVMIGVHGQALSGLIVHLPAHERKTACVEIRPAPDPRSYEWITMVGNMAKALGVLHLALTARHAPGCAIDKLRAKNCSTAACVLGVKKALNNFAFSSVLNCNVTVAPVKLLTLIQRAANHTQMLH